MGDMNEPHADETPSSKISDNGNRERFVGVARARRDAEEQFFDAREYMRSEGFSSSPAGAEGYVLFMCREYLASLLIQKGQELLNQGRTEPALGSEMRRFTKCELDKLAEMHWSPSRYEFGDCVFTSQALQSRFERMIIRMLEKDLLPRLQHAACSGGCWTGADGDENTADYATKGASSEPLSNSSRKRTDPARWQDIQIVFIADDQVRVRDGRHTRVCGCGELGFLDGRSGQPNMAWAMLKLLAEYRGVMRHTGQAGTKWTVVEKRMQEIRKRLSEYFSIDADPLPFIPGTGYQALFKIELGPTMDR
jgi:hypothetical protein